MLLIPYRTQEITRLYDHHYGVMCKDVHHNPLKKSGVDIKVTQQRTTTDLGTDERSPGPGRKLFSLANVLFRSAKLQPPILISQNVDIQHLTPNLSPLNPRSKVCRRTDLNYGLHLRLFLHDSITYTRQTPQGVPHDPTT